MISGYPLELLAAAAAKMIAKEHFWSAKEAERFILM